MTESPQDTIRQAADGMRKQSTSRGSYRPELLAALADLMDVAANDFDMVERINSRDPDSDGKTRVMDHPLASAALKIARVYLEGTGD